MPSAVIVSAVRTAIATARKGALARTTGEELARAILEAAVERSRLPIEMIDDVVFAESLYGGGALARHAAVEAGMTRVAGMAVNRHCAGSLTAVGIAAASIMTGMERVVVAGGVQSTSLMPQMRQRIGGGEEWTDWWIPPTHPDSADAPNADMSITVGWNAALSAGISREEMDAWALRSHQRAIAAIDGGKFKNEVVSITARGADGSAQIFDTDEHPRRDSSLEKMASLKPIHPEIEGFSITAGNASGMNDGAAALTVTSTELAKSEGLDVMARVKGWTAIGIAPRDTGIAVPRVVEKLLGRAGFRAQDVALWEINEAFASVPIAASRALGLDEELINISGSGCSIGHPVAASGGRMLATLIHDLKRRGGGLGVAAMCAGGGQAGAILIEV